MGALSIGTVLAGRSLERVVRVGLVVFAGFLAVFSLAPQPAPAYPAILLVGLAYFAVITSLSTVLQQRLDDSNRGRVMALWIMGFGGTVPIGNLIAGPAHRGHVGHRGDAGRRRRRPRPGRLRRPRDDPPRSPPTTTRPPTPTEASSRVVRARAVRGQALEAGDAAALDEDGVAVAEVAERGERPRRSIATSSPP